MQKDVWLDVEKSSAELAPAMLIHRASDMLIEIETSNPGGGNIAKIMNGKQIKLDRQLLAWSFHGELRWAALAMGRYTQEQRDQVIGFATA